MIFYRWQLVVLGICFTMLFGLVGSYDHEDAFINTPKNITKEYAFILQVNYVLARAFKASIKVSDQYAIEKALTDMDKKGIKLTFAGLMMHNTIFE